jgi:branched-chain amino acid transport system substrate-binding protein
MLQAMAETKGTDSAKIVDHLEKGATFDILKPRKGMFRPWDHQLLQEMYVVAVKDRAKMKDKWDIFDVVMPVPASNESLELIQPTKQENPCTLAT